MHVHLEPLTPGCVRVIRKHAGTVMNIAEISATAPFSIMMTGLDPQSRDVSITTHWLTGYGKAKTLRSRWKKAIRAYEEAEFQRIYGPA